MFVLAFALPGQVPQDPLVGEGTGADAGQGRQVKVGDMGEAEHLADPAAQAARRRRAPARPCQAPAPLDLPAPGARIGLIGNRNSGRAGRGALLAQAVAGQDLPVAETESLAELDAALAAFAASGVEVLAVHGGDGTVDAVIAALRARPLFPREPLLALLSGGTTNMTHGDVGLRGRAPAALDRLRRAVAAGLRPDQVVARAPLRVTCPAAPEAAPSPGYGFFFAAAAIPRVIRQTRARFHRRGLTGQVSEALALGGALRRLRAGQVANDPLLRPDPLAVTLDGGVTHEAPTVMLLATTLERLLLGLRPAPPAPGRIGVAALEVPYARLGRRLPAFLRGRPLPGGAGDGLWRAQAASAVLGADGEATLDGELFPLPEGAPLHLAPAAPVRFVTV